MSNLETISVQEARMNLLRRLTSPYKNDEQDMLERAATDLRSSGIAFAFVKERSGVSIWRARNGMILD